MILYLIANIQTLVDGFKALCEGFCTEVYTLLRCVLKSSATVARMAVVQVIYQNRKSAPSCGASEKKPLTLAQKSVSA